MLLDRRSRRWLGALSLLVAVGAAGLLLIAVWSSHRGVRDAASAVARAQAGALAETLRAELRLAEGPPGRALLTSLIEAHRADGLRFLGLLGPDGRVELAAGEPQAPPLTPQARPPESGVSLHRGRVRVVVAGPAPRRSRAGPGAPPSGPTPPGALVNQRPPPAFVIEVEPLLSRQLSGQARRTLLAGALGAAVIIIAALVLLWLARRGAQIERRLAAKRELEALGQMSAVLAHEMRNPLAAVKGHLQLLAERFAEGSRERKKVDRVLDETARLEGLTESLLDFVRSGAIARAPADPLAVLRGASAIAPGAELQIDAEGAPARWPLDQRRLELALGNLLRNAAQAAPQSPIEVRVRGADGALIYEIRDHGPGVPAELMAELFKPFMTTRLRGTGLGLAVSRRIVEAHGGTLEVANPAGGGACFRMIIPERGGPSGAKEEL